MLQHCTDCPPIDFLPLNALVRCGKIPRAHERCTVSLCELRLQSVRVMVSHRWLLPNADPSLAHPDDQENHKHALLVALFQRLGMRGWICNFYVVDVVNWLDFGKSLQLVLLLHMILIFGFKTCLSIDAGWLTNEHRCASLCNHT